ncbi:hypothetical protein [Streptomyces chartreusis]|uniref:hypothetical protein n=1 Tax=Streptomyces chartreusis TaxID=1969 RepID=UPI002F91717E|nr:hypothetical protein OG938_48560 [Streptomyces chartreusis]
MSEQSRGPAEPPRDTLAVWQRTRDLDKRIDGVSERLDTLEGLNLGDAVADLALTVKKLAEKPKSPKIAVWNWQLMNPQQQAEAWGFLLDWVMNTFRVRYPRSFMEMLGYDKSAVSCWHLHEDMVESLTGLMGAWHWAFTDPNSEPLRVAEWLGRWRADAVQQGKFILAKCNLHPEPNNPYAGHKDPLANKHTDPPPDLLQHIHLLKTGEVPS